ncbi:glycosyltransferase [Roseiconus nitratireducens]|uniref:Glycosyltransferase n=1 Tax=Roseiconus nitratireducens TaxID=2605748 RepID=A0A5M6DIV8_9BACT|nr:glycosyltransferase family 2 protein [Roseiconus nitratireducens]KAA5546139.1 glycosyltransferase [Roseiconus nitratireducens]
MTTVVIMMVWLVALAVSLPLLVVTVQCVLAMLPGRSLPRGERDSIGVLIPAHNEAGAIQRTVQNIREQMLADDRLLVIADNCSDNTAPLAGEAGAEVIERNDPDRRGKGFALDAGIRALAGSPPGTVIIVDADCQVGSDALDRLARSVTATGRPVQARYLMRMPADSSPESAVSVFAFLVKNWVRARAMQRLNLPILLTGTGMAFPWTVIEKAPLASGEIVEDLALGLLLTRRGSAPSFCEEAHVWSELPVGAAAAIEQRTRWEHGYLACMIREIPRLLRDAVVRLKPHLALVAIDLMVPPLSLLAIVSLLGWAITGALFIWAGTSAPFWILTTIGFAAVLSILMAYFRFGKHIVSVESLRRTPGYVLGKLGIYRRLFGRRQTHWVRTQREAERHGEGEL